jgi:hypothetical protein
MEGYLSCVSYNTLEAKMQLAGSSVYIPLSPQPWNLYKGKVKVIPVLN